MTHPPEPSKSTWSAPRFPGTSFAVSRVAIGTWAIGGWMWGGTDEAQSVATIRAALDHGINLIDTAPVYGFGRSEEIVGKAIAERGLRQKVLIASKAGLGWKDGRVFRDASRARILQEIEDLLRRLRTDHIDIYQVHWPDPSVAVEETADAMLTLLRQGKIRAIGVSNFSTGQIERFRRVAPLHVVQPPYNMFERAIEAELLPYCRAHEIATLGYGASVSRPLVRADAAGYGFRGRRSAPQPTRNSSRPGSRNTWPPCSRLDRFAQERFGKRVIALAVRWMLDQGITTALWGARRPDQLQAVDEVSGWQIDAAAKAEIDRILRETIAEPVGPEFMAPPARKIAA